MVGFCFFFVEYGEQHEAKHPADGDGIGRMGGRSDRRKFGRRRDAADAMPREFLRVQRRAFELGDLRQRHGDRIRCDPASESNLGNTTLNWSSFNISADGKVVFNQPNGNSIALNRIFDSNPSSIFGALTANGQIYLVNQNGFVFGSSSSVNVGGLIASSLDISDSTFSQGLLAPIGNAAPALSYTPGPDGQPLASTISVQPGASISTNGPGQRILLAAPTVTNGGTISAPDGQAILASGQSVYLYASTDPKLRGLLVEVAGGGATTNTATGNINSARGDVTLIGLAVNQDGRVSATTSTSANGSVRLLARSTDLVTDVPGTSTPLFEVQTGGTLELGPQSVTSVLPDPTDHSTVVDAQVQLPSTLELSGAHVTLQGGSQINAPSGQLSITAAVDPATPSAPGDSTFRMDAGASIDLAGSTDTVPVTRNLVTVQLRGTGTRRFPSAEKWSPARHNRNRGCPGRQWQWHSARQCQRRTWLDSARYLRTHGYRRHSLCFTTGDVAVANGAVINVSGGAVNYTGGIMQTSETHQAGWIAGQYQPGQPHSAVYRRGQSHDRNHLQQMGSDQLHTFAGHCLLRARLCAGRLGRVHPIHRADDDFERHLSGAGRQWTFSAQRLRRCLGRHVHRWRARRTQWLGE